jgi:hypothetical protein
LTHSKRRKEVKKIIENYKGNEWTRSKQVEGGGSAPCPKRRIFILSWLLLVLPGLAITTAPVAAIAQVGSETQAASAAVASSDSVVPRLIQFSGTVKDTDGKPAANSVQLTFSLYQFEEGGSPLWVETQTVQPDSQGHYSVLLGAASPDGLPQDLFSSGSARWLGVQPALPGAGEQPRVLLVGVPYALKAADAETLGGKPASAYVTTETYTAPTDEGSPGAMPAGADGQSRPPANTGRVRKGTFSSSPPASCTKVTADGTATANQVAKFTSGCAIHQSLMFDNGTDVGVNTTSPAATLDVNGNISGRDNLALPQTTSSSIGVITLGGSRFAHACCSTASHNTFVGVNAGPVTGGGNSNTAAGFQALNALTSGFSNTAIGTDALQFTTTGEDNTGVGLGALDLNTSGSFNTAVGENALEDDNGGGGNTGLGSLALNLNTSGTENTAVGEEALNSNTTGNLNSALGFLANVNSGNLTNATAIGANSLVSESNAIVLGCTFNCAVGTSQPNVGIGTTTPLSPLDVLANGSSIHTLIGNVGCGNSNAGIIFATTLNANCQTYAISGDTGGNTYVDAPGGELHLRISPNTDAMIITSSGAVGIGTTSPDNTLTVNGSADKPGGGSWGVFSDGRLKTVEGTYDAGLDTILKLNPIRYRYKEQNAMGIRDHQQHIGFVAQDVEKAIPEAVSRNSQGYLLVNNDPILWTMLNAIKQQQAEIEALTRSAREKDVQIRKLTAQGRLLHKLQRQIASLEGKLTAVEVSSDSRMSDTEVATISTR